VRDEDVCSWKGKVEEGCEEERERVRVRAEREGKKKKKSETTSALFLCWCGGKQT